MELQLINIVERLRLDVCEQTQAFVLLEAGRLRCERLTDTVGCASDAGSSDPVSGAALLNIHWELGMAGYVLSDPLSAEIRRRCTGLAREMIAAAPILVTRSTGTATAEDAPASAPDAGLGPVLAQMFSDAIAASDALARTLADERLDDTVRDRLYLVHAHVMAACERLDEALTALELAATDRAAGQVS